MAIKASSDVENLFKEFETSLTEEPFFRWAQEASSFETPEKIQKVVDLLLNDDFLKLPLDNQLNILKRCELRDADPFSVKMGLNERMFLMLDQVCISFKGERDQNLPFEEGVKEFEEAFQQVEKRTSSLKEQTEEILDHLDSITTETPPEESNRNAAALLTSALNISLVAARQFYQSGKNWMQSTQILSTVTRQD